MGTLVILSNIYSNSKKGGAFAPLDHLLIYRQTFIFKSKQLELQLIQSERTVDGSLKSSNMFLHFHCNGQIAIL